MFLFFAMVGMAVVAVAAGFVLVAIFYAVRDWLLERRHSQFHKWMEGEMYSFATRLSNDSYWFSEDTPTMNLLQNMAASITSSRGLAYPFGIDTLRDKWRRDREQQKTHDAKIHPAADISTKDVIQACNDADGGKDSATEAIKTCPPAKATDLGQQPRPCLYEHDSDKFLPKAPIRDD